MGSSPDGDLAHNGAATARGAHHVEPAGQAEHGAAAARAHQAAGRVEHFGTAAIARHADTTAVDRHHRGQVWGRGHAANACGVVVGAHRHHGRIVDRAVVGAVGGDEIAAYNGHEVHPVGVGGYERAAVGRLYGVGKHIVDRQRHRGALSQVGAHAHLAVEAVLTMSMVLYITEQESLKDMASYQRKILMTLRQDTEI